MKKISKLLGSFFLGVASLIIVVGPASLTSIAVEELPKSMKNKR